MSYALETKKRKFTRVLESISKPLASGDGGAKPPTDPLMAARERLAEPPSIKKVRVGEGVLDKVSTKTTVSRILRTTSSSANLRPNFVPWDRERFLERLETFRPVTRWLSQPSPINEVEWAKRGWSCTDYMRVACVGGCGASLVVKLPEEVDDFEDLDSDKVQERKEVRQKVVEEYRKLLSDGHKENCLWRSKACDGAYVPFYYSAGLGNVTFELAATIHRLQVTNPDNAINALRDRYLKISKLQDQLPARETIELPEQLSLKEMIDILPPGFPGDSPNNSLNDDTSQQSDGKENTIDERSFAFAFFGWDVVKDGSSGLLECRACFRRLGLWLYKSKEEGKEAVYEKLPVHSEHMDYCPWINGPAQSGTGRATDRPESLSSGWQVLAQGLRTKHRRRVKTSASATPTESVPTEADTLSLDSTATDEASQRAKDREWWSKLRRVREALHVKGPKKASSQSK
ncbi:hypothetical protein UA08_08569 [Talaromyces atroroseus]|uniref:C3HC-type domain-containing protein n=1 Tax=Talaromyces atroroseus TaxID=1441469 RepID=A0A1Q5Q7U5_TALAT|nr:hypothetical protein UA08_08569 [Talaromyces atroroseus]OKL56295.1 hypothetical protein UA08_08569 [Talaromyces atroroseus]